MKHFYHEAIFNLKYVNITLYFLYLLSFNVRAFLNILTNIKTITKIRNESKTICSSHPNVNSTVAAATLHKS